MAAGLIAVSASPAAADSGDGNVACNNGEICFQFTYGSNNSIKQFWNGANHYSNAAHGAYYWFSTLTGSQTSTLLLDRAEGLRNRDTSCTVYLWDVDAYGNWFMYDSEPKQSTSFWNIGAKRNNGHSRCDDGYGHLISPVNL